MDVRNRMLLQQYQQDIIKDLDVFHIIEELFTKNVITGEDFERITNLSSRVDRVRFLIDPILLNGSNENYEAFVDSLAKDYRWLWEKLAIPSNDTMGNDSFEDSLSRGDVPRLPDHYVRRNTVEQVVTEKLKTLLRHKFLVLHGMSGAGKTSVAAGVLRSNPDLITNNFNGVVFWLNFGNCKTDDDIIAQQNRLYRKASSIYNNSFMNSSVSMSSIGSNADSHSLSGYEWTIDELRDKLKAQFSTQAVKDCLLVLDEVNDKRCVDAFDIGCKILITTRDTDIVPRFESQIIKIENNFTERETLNLFASCLEVNVNKLPRQAKKLHEICKGSPFHIALIGAQLAENREKLIHDISYWNYYINKLEKKDFFFLSRNNNNPMKTIEICINSLDPKIQFLFKMLTILPDNAKVTPIVLSKLWKEDANKVQSIMKQLRSKSLVQEFYDHEQKSYVYEIHDLIMNYLRTCKTEEEVQKLHEDFLKSYNYDNVTNVPVEIVDDGYIAFYIGYHIMNTRNKRSLFNKLFLDLKFLGNKVRLTGPADVILDLQKYEKLIAHDTHERDLLNSIKAYLSTHGIDLYRYPCTDIVQSILQHETKGILYTKALHVAQEKCAKNELYFEFLHENNVEEIKPSHIDVKESIKSVCFLGDYALVGTKSGVIKFFHIATNKLKKELPDIGSPVKWLGACPVNPPIIAALSDKGVIKIWYIDDLEQDETNADGIIEEEAEEPYNNNYPNNVTIQPKLGEFINCRWANKAEILVAHTSKLVILYSRDGTVVEVVDRLEQDRYILSCIPCNKDRHVIMATTNGISHVIEVVNLKTKEVVMSVEETGTVLDMVTIPGNDKFLALKSNEVQEYEFRQNTNSYPNSITCRCKNVITSDLVKENLIFTSFAVNKSGTLLFVSTDESRVICIDLKNHTRVFDLENSRGNVVSMAVSEVFDDFMPGSDVLLTGTGTTEYSVKVWYLDNEYVSQNTKNGKVRLTTKFDVSFVHTLSPQTPNSTTTNSSQQSATNTPQRHQSFVNHKEVEKKLARKTMSLDRHCLKPLVLKGINGNIEEGGLQPLLAVVDDKNNIQIIRGRKLLTEITLRPDEQVTVVKISPCNQHVFYGLKSGSVKKYTLRTKEKNPITDVNSPVQYLNFVNPNLLMVAGRNRCLMAYRLTNEGEWTPQMLQSGNTHLGSQEILNDIQGKRKISQQEKLTNSDSESSLSSRDRLFPNGDRPSLCRSSGLVECFWVRDTGLITVEHNATIKLWDQELKLVTVLSGRQIDVRITCATLQKNVLVICDDDKGFQTFGLKEGEPLKLQPIQDYKLNNRIVSCDLTADGYILAMGLDSGDVVLWNVPSKRQLRLLKHHKTKVNSCTFSPVPGRAFRSGAASSPAPPPAYADADDDQPPLVLLTMASEIVWWNITYLIRMKPNNKYLRWNVVTPAASPITEMVTAVEELSVKPSNNFFFPDGLQTAQDCWKALWKRKTYKEGSKKKEILACIKLFGMNAKKLCHDDKYSCFVTVDNPGHIHIMSVMRPNST